MKKQIKSQFSRVGKTIMRFSLASFVFIGLLPGLSHAQDKPAPVASVHYVGDVDGQPLFQVVVDNKSGEVYNLTIKDQEGVVFYSERFTDKSFVKKFKFDKQDDENVKLTFILSSPTAKDQVFQVNTNVQVFKDVVVTRL